MGERVKAISRRFALKAVLTAFGAVALGESLVAWLVSACSSSGVGTGPGGCTYGYGYGYGYGCQGPYGHAMRSRPDTPFIRRV